MRETHSLQSLARQERQISKPLATLTRHGHKALHGCRQRLHKGLAHFIAHLKSLGANAWPQPDLRFCCQLRIGSHTQSGGVSLPDGFQYAMAVMSCQSAPARMGCSNGAPAAVCQQDGQAVRHHDNAGHIRFSGQTGVKGLSIGRCVLQKLNIAAMYLLQEAGLHWATGNIAQHRLQQRPVGRYMLRVIMYVVTQVHGVPRSYTLPTCTGGKQGMHASNGGPIGLQPQLLKMLGISHLHSIT